jgi:hypothetical protein
LKKKFLNLFIKVTEKAAIGASKFVGKKIKLLLIREQLIQ